jgi:hypothetical protein
LKTAHDLSAPPGRLRSQADSQRNGVRRSLTLPVLDTFVRSWDFASSTHRSRIGLLRSFFGFGIARKWFTDNPAAGLILPEDTTEPTLPFTAQEESAIFERIVHVYKTYQTKTLEWVMCPRPPDVAAEIQAAPRLSNDHAFMPPKGSAWKTDAHNVAIRYHKSYRWWSRL